MRAARGLSSGIAGLLFAEACAAGCPGREVEAPRPPIRAFMSCCCCSSDHMDGSGVEANEGGCELLGFRDMVGGVPNEGVSSPRKAPTLVVLGRDASGGSRTTRTRKNLVQSETMYVTYLHAGTPVNPRHVQRW